MVCKDCGKPLDCNFHCLDPAMREKLKKYMNCFCFKCRVKTGLKYAKKINIELWIRDMSNCHPQIKDNKKVIEQFTLESL